MDLPGGSTPSRAVEEMLLEEEGAVGGSSVVVSSQLAAVHQGVAQADLEEVVPIDSYSAFNLTALSEQVSALQEEMSALHQSEDQHLEVVQGHLEEVASGLQTQLTGLMAEYSRVSMVQADQAVAVLSQTETHAAEVSVLQAEIAALRAKIEQNKAPTVDQALTWTEKTQAISENAEKATASMARVEGQLHASQPVADAFKKVASLGKMASGFAESVQSATRLMRESISLKDNVDAIRTDKKMRATLCEQLAEADCVSSETGCPVMSTQERAQVESEIKSLSSTIREKRLALADKIYQIFALIVELIASFMRLIQGLLQLLGTTH